MSAGDSAALRIDALGFYENVSAGQRALFVSTIGNKLFRKLHLGAWAVWRCLCIRKRKSWKMRLFYMITGIIIFAGSACSNSDGAILGAGDNGCCHMHLVCKQKDFVYAISGDFAGHVPDFDCGGLYDLMPRPALSG